MTYTNFKEAIMLEFSWQDKYLSVKQDGNATLFWVYRCVLHQDKVTAKTIPGRQTLITSSAAKEQGWKDLLIRYVPIAVAISDAEYNKYLSQRATNKALPSSLSISANINQTPQVDLTRFDLESRANLGEKAVPNSTLLNFEIVQLRYDYWQLYFVETDTVENGNLPYAELPGVWERVRNDLKSRPQMESADIVEADLPPAVGP
jgi:hypothetical protein